MNAARLALDSIDRYGEYTAIWFEGDSRTNLEQDRWAKRLATVLLDVGVSAGDRVLVQMPNCPEVLAAFQAIWKIGAVIVPVTPQWGAREACYLAEDSEAKVVITQPEFADRWRGAGDALPACEKVLSVGACEEMENVAPLIDAADAYEAVRDRGENDLAMLLYTSGTTGQPKGVMLTHENLMSNHRAVAALDRLKPQSPTLLTLPLSHSFGVLMMNLTNIFGAPASIHRKFDPEEVVEAIDRFKVTRFAVVPTMLTALNHFEGLERYDVSSLESVNSGGAILPNEVRVAFERKYDCRVLEGYGMSECSPTATSYHHNDTYRPGSVGKAIPGVEVTIQDETGRVLRSREEGEICIKGPNVMKGYWKSPEATEEALRGGWLHSGDIGFMDEDGYVFITDRIKDLIIKGGENISPREIEEAIYQHPAVSEVAVIGVPDDRYGENLWAVVSSKAGSVVSEAELLAHAARYVTKYKLPAKVIFKDALPKNPTGKISKKDLRAELVSAPTAL